MKTPAIAMLLAGAANLLPALFFLFTALLGSNGMDSTQGGRLLGGVALLLVLGWVAALFLAQRVARWVHTRGWTALASVAAAGTGAVAAYTLLALLATFAMLLAVGA